MSINFIKSNKYPLITTLASITETLHLLDFNRNAQIDFLEWISRGAVEIYNIQNNDFKRLKDLTEKYRDLPLDFADSCLVYLVVGRKHVFGRKIAHMQGARNPETGVYYCT